MCGAKAGPCDVDDYCSGSDATCHDNFLPTLCRAADGPCDAEDYCSGTDAACEDGKEAPDYKYGMLIDHFKTPQTLSVVMMAPPTQSAGSCPTTLTAIGGERDLCVAKTAGSYDERLRVCINPNDQELFRSAVDEKNGIVVVTWDGLDGLSEQNQVNYTGLGGRGGRDSNFSYSWRH